MVKIALDAMGGDNAPAEIVKGAVQAIAADKDCFVYLVGKEDKIKECLNGQQYDSSRIEIVNADDVIETGEPPVMAIRRKKESSQMSKLNRRERVHRLCTRAGMLESFLVCPGELTDDQVMELLKISFRQPEVVLALAKMVHDVHERSNVQNPLE